ncbi:hypothetical protein [Methylobacterium nonmethylotrophicum]|uniref:Type IV pilus biogenesis protein PilP n=1 Tax=Methylobacterium nonmethylotrophicum TaxID=1141884 RepID=A0A4Z0NUU1_9HYPH|nr:hypothetical protein [Methylobacterium nonmethylotrophicum]TGE01043.1 hypothetical protein EU555_05395 [Methylobacterium nonmethylotrophicum]
MMSVKLIRISFLFLFNIFVFLCGIMILYKEYHHSKEPFPQIYLPTKAEFATLSDKFVRATRRSDEKVQSLFMDAQRSAAASTERSHAAASEIIEPARLVGIIVPLEAAAAKIAVIEYGVRSRTVRARRGDIIPGTSWKVANIDDKEITIIDDKFEFKMSLK